MSKKLNVLVNDEKGENNTLQGFIDYMQNPPALPAFHIKNVEWSERRVSVIFSDNRELAFIIDKDGTIKLYSDNMAGHSKIGRDVMPGERVMPIKYFGTPD